MIFGYARVSKLDEQDTLTQENALNAAGVQRIFKEKASGSRWDRPELHRMLDQIREDDVVVVWKLDRLPRSLKDLLHIMEKIKSAKAGFKSLTEHIDTTTPAGHMLMQIVGSFAEFERAMIRERTYAGLETARAQGRIGGRRPKLNEQQKNEIVKMVSTDRKSASEAARIFNVHPATISRLLMKSAIELQNKTANQKSNKSEITAHGRKKR
jgi:DNA invertase Pin-like site-specific DNA recombinase